MKKRSRGREKRKGKRKRPRRKIGSRGASGRKKTEEKCSIDGGIGITFEVCDENQPSRINITAKRISNGQVISKVFSEAMIIKTFVNGLNNDGVNIEKKVGIGHKELLQKCRVESIFHRWM